MHVNEIKKCFKMPSFLVYILVFSFYSYIKCELSLKILKRTGDNFTPVISRVVEEKAGANFSLLCDLVSSDKDSDFYDFQVSWIRQSNDLRFWREHDSDDGTKSKKIYSILKPSEMNKAVKHFHPLKPEDSGKYFCVSLKYNLFELVEVIVQDEKPHYIEEMPLQETIFCSAQMFRCSNGYCIIHHYICDGKPDCKDGSDESIETCKGDPCRNKLHCDDGRCIPTSWCCDRHHDPNCNVTNRPKCCQMLSDSYEDLEYGTTTFDSSYNRTNYAYISICVVFILFLIVVLLVFVSKAVLNEKNQMREARNVNTNAENIALHNQSSLLNFSYSYQNNNRHANDLIIDNCDVSDPLLFGGIEEQPPPYIDVIRAQNCRLNTPPPPYTSLEDLNRAEDRSRGQTNETVPHID